jgi:hypothetical protein
MSWAELPADDVSFSTSINRVIFYGHKQNETGRPAAPMTAPVSSRRQIADLAEVNHGA